MSTDSFPRQEEEFLAILEGHEKDIISQVHSYNLPKYGLDPEDVIQDVKVRIWKLICGGRIIRKHGPYIKRIVYTAIIDQFRKKRRESDLVQHEKLKHISEMETHYRGDAVRSRGMSEELTNAVDRLIKSRRRVVKLYLLNLNIREIAIYLNVSPDKIRNLLYRGLSDIRKHLNGTRPNNEDHQ
jgi:RNA polymerase sigma factor (sigma-70 family)